MTAERQSLIEEITAAFDGVSREGGISLHEAEQIDCHGIAEERAEARKVDTDRRWQDVPDQWLEELPAVPHFLDAVGFRYYLPAYMIWAMKRGKESDSATADSIVANLADTRRVTEILPRLTAEQRQ